MGDGTAIPYTGAIRKEPIEADSLDEAFERLQERAWPNERAGIRSRR